MSEKNFWHGRKVFITGGAGFLGPWLAKSLIENGSELTLLLRDEVHKSSLKLLEVSSYNLIRGDVLDYALVERIINEYGIEVVFHLAAQSIVGIANKSPLGTLNTNIIGTCNVLEACRRLGSIKRIIVASSDKAYGTHEKLPYLESFPLQGMAPYEVSKSCADLISQAFFHTYNLPVRVVRCGNLYGGGDLNFSRIIPGTIQSVLNNEEPIIRSDGTFKRDYLYVEDAVYAYMSLVENESNSLNGEAFNFGSGTQISVIDLVKKIIDISGRKGLKPKILNQAKTEIKDQYLSSEKAMRMLGWKPRYTLENGLKKAFLWYKNYLAK